MPDARGPARGAHNHDVGDGDGRFLLGDSALDVPLAVGPHALLHHHHVLHQHLGLVRKNAQHAALLASVAAGNDFHRIVAPDINSGMHAITLWFLNPSQHFRREGDNLQEFLFAQLAGHRTEHARADGLAGIIDEHGGVLVKADVSSILAAMFLALAHDHTLDYRTLFGGPVRRCLFDRGGNNVTQSGSQPGVPAPRQDHLQAARAAIIGHIENASHHDCHSSISITSAMIWRAVYPAAKLPVWFLRSRYSAHSAGLLYQ